MKRLVFLFLPFYVFFISGDTTEEPSCDFYFGDSRWPERVDWRQSQNPLLLIRSQRLLSGDSIEARIARVLERERRQDEYEALLRREVAVIARAQEKAQQETALRETHQIFRAGNGNQILSPEIANYFQQNYQELVQDIYAQQAKRLQHSAQRWREDERHAPTKQQRKRCARRLKGLQEAQQNNGWQTESYLLSAQAQCLLENHGIPITTYSAFSGNHVQHILHKEIIEAIDGTASVINKYPTSEVKRFAWQALQCAQAAGQCNRLGSIDRGFHMSDLAHNLLSFARIYGSAVAEGAWAGVCRFFHSVFHPIQSAQELAQSAGLVAKSVARVVYGLGELGYLKTENPDKFLTRLKEIKDTLTDFKGSLQNKLESTSPPEAVKEIVALATGVILPGACFKAIKPLLNAAKSQQISTRVASSLKKLACEEKTELLLHSPEGVIVTEALQGVGATMHKQQITASAVPQAVPVPVRGCGLPCGSQKHYFIPDSIASCVPSAQELAALELCYNNKIKGFAGIGNNLVTFAFDHILAPSIECLKKGMKLTGFHHDSLGKMQKSGVITFTDVIIMRDGTYRAKWWYKGQSKTSSFFPQQWDRKKVMDKIVEAYNSCSSHELQPNGNWLRQGVTSEGIKVEIMIAKDGKIISAYPI
jgi:hypothetical protein